MFLKNAVEKVEPQRSPGFERARTFCQRRDRVYANVGTTASKGGRGADNQKTDHVVAQVEKACAIPRFDRVVSPSEALQEELVFA